MTRCHGLRRWVWQDTTRCVAASSVSRQSSVIGRYRMPRSRSSGAASVPSSPDVMATAKHVCGHRQGGASVQPPVAARWVGSNRLASNRGVPRQSSSCVQAAGSHSAPRLFRACRQCPQDDRRDYRHVRREAAFCVVATVSTHSSYRYEPGSSYPVFPLVR